jgi:hypothetical protein
MLMRLDRGDILEWIGLPARVLARRGEDALFGQDDAGVVEVVSGVEVWFERSENALPINERRVRRAHIGGSCVLLLPTAHSTTPPAPCMFGGFYRQGSRGEMRGNCVLVEAE